MPTFRAFLRDHRRLALGLVVLALLIKALIPTGYMLGEQAGHVLTVTICGDASGQTLTKHIAVPVGGDHAKAEVKCVWGLLAMAALGGADVLLLAAALAFILALGFLAVRPALPARRSRPCAVLRHSPDSLNRPAFRGPAASRP